MLKKILCIVMAAMMLVALSACTDSDLLKRVEELEATVGQQSSKITELEGKNKEQSDKISELEDKNKEQSDKISELEDKNKEQSDTITELEDRIGDLQEENDHLYVKVAPQIAGLFDLEYAYEQGWLTREDLMHISYFYNGKVVEGTLNDRSTWHEVEFAPQIETPVLSKKMEQAIKEVEAYYIRHREGPYPHPNASADDISIRHYVGEYNGCWVVMIEGNSDYMPAAYEVEIDGIIIMYHYYNFFQVYREY